MSSAHEWKELATAIIGAAREVFNRADVPVTEKGARDPKVVALSLLARSISNCEAALRLLDSGQVVEARTLVRCIWENLFWAAALVKKGADFVQEIVWDDAVTRRKRANRLLDWSRAQDEPRDFEGRLEGFIQGLDVPKGGGIKHLEAASAGSIRGGYIIYGELSTDAAHPSALSLSRHVSWDEEDQQFTLHAEAIVDEGEAEQTIEFACSALLGVAVAANELVNSGVALAPIAERFTKLSTDSSASRKAKKK